MLEIETAEITIPTYQRGPDDPYPPLTFGGHIRRQYPYQMQDDVDMATMECRRRQKHRVVRMSNGLLEALVLPDMNGRLYSLRDLATGRELFYRNPVVKPALAALRGAWINGGIEFNFPTVGHTVSTVSPVFHRLTKSQDDVAVVVGDINRTTRQLWQARMSLRPDRAALDIEVTFFNPNHCRQGLYYWENAAVPATDDMRFVCRCDWTAGTDEPFPVRGGLDRSYHVNNPEPIDHFGYRSHADFYGAYYRDSRSATYHVAPRFQLPGQKNFTWGIGADNRIWLRYLTDTGGGQSSEIQAGILETQAVTGWLAGGTQVSATGCWFGTTCAEEVTWANRNVAVAVCENKRELALDIVPIDLLGPHVLTVQSAGGKSDHTIDCHPGHTIHLAIANPKRFKLTIRTPAGRLLLEESWLGRGTDGMDQDRPAAPPQQWCMMARTTPPRRQIESAEKYRRWQKVRTLLDDRKVVGPGPQRELLEALLHLKTARGESALQHALAGLAADPGSAELHIAAAAAGLRRLRITSRTSFAYAVRDHCLAARTDLRFRSDALRMLAETCLLQGRLLEARERLELLADDGAADPQTLALLAGTCRRGDDPTGAAEVVARAEATPWPHLRGEAWLLGVGALAEDQMPGGDDPCAVTHRCECVLEWLMLYWRVRWFDDLHRLLDEAGKTWPAVASHPIAHLLRADIALEHGRRRQARNCARRAAASSVEFVTPARWEDALLLERGIELLNSGAGHLTYLLGLFLAENDRVDRAVKLLRQSASATSAPRVRRLAAKALGDWGGAVKGDRRTALRYLRIADRAGRPDRRLIIAMDNTMHQLHDVRGRVRLLERVPAKLRRRGDVTYHLARLQFDRGRFAEALKLIRSTEFSVYEGGGSVRRLYVDALLADAMEEILAGRTDNAAERCRAVFEFPENLGAAFCLGEHSRLARFLLGLIARRNGRKGEARTWWRDVASRGAGSTVYSVGDPRATLLGRTDELLALELAAKRLGGRRSGTSAKRGRADGDEVQLAATKVAVAISARSRSAAARAECALHRYQCSSLLRVLFGLARVAPLSD